ncbi:MAG: N-acetyl-gamma-glutamyl-phosphate reductase [Acidimicrobiia bacterium]
MLTDRRRIGVVGARGHTGAELLSILNDHPGVEVVHAGSRELAGRPVPQISGLVFEDLTPEDLGRLSLDGVFLALPNGVSAPFVGHMSPDTAIVDISADHRFDDDWVYGLPELNREKLAGARRIANPGCYATVAQLLIAPFLELVDGVPAVFGVSGYSGAGTTPSEKNDPERLRDNLIPYSLVGHIHEREASLHLGRPIRFMPHVHPAFRGLIVTCHIPVTSIEPRQALALLEDHYREEPLIDVTKRVPELSDGTGMTGVLLGGLDVSDDGLNLVIVGVEDNLLKGAAVQAVQNLNLALGHPELTGIGPALR